MHHFIKIFIRILFIGLLFLIWNKYYASGDQYQQEKKTLKAWMLDDMDSLYPIKNAFYFAESSDFTYAESDTCKWSISKFLQELNPELKIGVIEKAASHAGTYLSVIENLPITPRPKWLIVTMNLRSFGYDWIESGLENSMNQSAVFYNREMPLFQRLRALANGYENIPNPIRQKEMIRQWKHNPLNFDTIIPYPNTKAWDDAMANGSFKNTDGTWDMPRIELACCFVKNYAFVLDTLSNPRLKDFDKIALLSKQKGYKLMFNILPENLQRSDSLCGPALKHIMLYNSLFLSKRYERMGAWVCNNIDILAKERFIDYSWPTEHYDEMGRRKIANNISECIRKAETQR